MKKTAKIVYSILAVAIIAVNFPITQASITNVAKDITSSVADVVEPKVAEASGAGGPAQFRIGIKDNGCSDQYADYGVANYPGLAGQDAGFVTDTNGKDPDCARINMDPGSISPGPGGKIYSQDFRIGIAVAESGGGCTDRKGAVQWTAWASEGGGESGFAHPYNGSVNAADCIWIYYETRNIPNPAIIQDARAGIGVGYSGIAYTPWASTGGGLSGWSVTNNDFTTARVGLNVRLNYKYNSSFVSTTIPQYPPSSLNKNQTTSNTIVMKNIPDAGASTAMPWVSDQEVSSSTNKAVAHCYDWTPANASDTCTQTTIYTSNKFKLRRTDANTSAVETPAGDLKYSRAVVSQFGATPEYGDEICTYPDNPPGGGGIEPVLLPYAPAEGLIQKLGLIKSAQAIIYNPGDLPECIPGPPTGNYLPIYLNQDRSQNVETNQTTNFDLNVTGRTDGTYTLKFQMVNIETGELFGDATANPATVASITVRIGSAWSFTCGANQIVPKGTNANYLMNASVASGYTSNINVTLSASNPTGPALLVSPVVLSSGTVPAYTNTAVIPTSTLVANQTYILTFSATDGALTQTCQANLSLISLVASVDLKFNNSDGPTTPSPANGSTGDLTWDTNNAANCTASMTQGTVPAWSGPKTVANVYDNGTQTQTITGLQASTTYTFKLDCVNIYNDQPPATDSVQVTVGTASSPTVNIQCQSGIIWKDTSCPVSYGAAGTLKWSSTNTSSCNLRANSTDLGPVATTSGKSNYSTGNLTQTTVYTITCTGPGGSANDSVTMVVSDTPPNSPAQVQATKPACGAITITWTNGAGSQNPQLYRVYRNTTGNDANFAQVGADFAFDGTPGHVYSYTDNNPAPASNYYAVAAWNGNAQSPYYHADVYPIAPNACAANISTSDKDVLSVAGHTNKVFSPIPCSGASEIAALPNNALYAPGDVVTFQINVCNTGTLALTGIRVSDTLTNLSNPVVLTSSPPGCVTGSSVGSGTVTFNVANVGPTNGVCGVKLSAVVTAPSNSTAALYRFQNIADISSNELPTKRVVTPPYLFSLTGGVPDRTETAPN